MTAAYVVNTTNLVKNYKKASTKEEEVIAIMDLIKKSQEENKHEILSEIHLKNFATTHDLELGLERTKNILIMWMIGICGIWVPTIMGIIVKCLG